MQQKRARAQMVRRSRRQRQRCSMPRQSRPRPSPLSSSSSLSSDTLFPVVDLTPLLLPTSPFSPAPAALAASKAIAASLVATGCVLVRDPRVSEERDNRGLPRPARALLRAARGREEEDARPELHYQVGATPEGVERPSMLREESTSAARARRLVEKIKGLEERRRRKDRAPPLVIIISRRGPEGRTRSGDSSGAWAPGPRRPPSRSSTRRRWFPQAFEEEWEETLDGYEEFSSFFLFRRETLKRERRRLSFLSLPSPRSLIPPHSLRLQKNARYEN